MIVGTEWLIDAHGCDALKLRNAAALRALLERVLERLQLHVVGEGQWHVFPGEGGVTGMYLLRESHLTCHTYPEHNLATFNLYCCRPRPMFPWEKELKERLLATRVVVKQITRGAANEEQ